MDNVTNIEKLLDLGFSIGRLADEVTQGFSFKEIGDFITVLKNAGPAISNAKLALDQYVKMTDADAVGLEKYVEDNFHVSDAQVEATITQALKAVIELHSLVALLRPQVMTFAQAHKPKLVVLRNRPVVDPRNPAQLDPRNPQNPALQGDPRPGFHGDPRNPSFQVDPHNNPMGVESGTVTRDGTGSVFSSSLADAHMYDGQPVSTDAYGNVFNSKGVLIHKKIG